MEPWDDHHLEGRPACPYVPGFTMSACPHTPPEPFGSMGYSCEPPPYYKPPHKIPRLSDLYDMTRMEIVMATPPREKHSSLSSSPDIPKSQPAATHRIEIKKVLYGGDLHGAQIVLCTVQVLADKRRFTAVAKIYDPLYYRYYRIDFDGQEVQEDPIIDAPEAADGDYSCEAAAYEHFQTRNMEGCTAAYYGSYTFTLDTLPGHRPRHVRCILIEYLDGLCLARLPSCKNAQNEDYCMAVFARILEAKARIWHSRLSNLDEMPRNWMVVPLPPEHSPIHDANKGGETETMPAPASVRVVMIDFGNSCVWSRTDTVSMRGHREVPEQVMPTNPLVQQWDFPSVEEYGKWVPEWYLDRERGHNIMRRHRWLKKEFYDGCEAQKYESISFVPEVGKAA